jgi:hypothetical protein
MGLVLSRGYGYANHISAFYPPDCHPYSVLLSYPVHTTPSPSPRRPALPPGRSPWCKRPTKATRTLRPPRRSSRRTSPTRDPAPSTSRSSTPTTATTRIMLTSPPTGSTSRARSRSCGTVTSIARTWRAGGDCAFATAIAACGRAGVGRRWRGCGIRGGCGARELDSRRLWRAGVPRTARREVREAVAGDFCWRVRVGSGGNLHCPLNS